MKISNLEDRRLKEEGWGGVGWGRGGDLGISKCVSKYKFPPRRGMFFTKTDTDKKQVVVTSDMIPMLEREKN